MHGIPRRVAKLFVLYERSLAFARPVDLIPILALRPARRMSQGQKMIDDEHRREWS